jgi:hypothetical protein
MDDAHGGSKLHGTNLALNAPGKVTVLMRCVGEEAVEAANGNECRAAICHVAGQKATAVVVGDRVLVQGRKFGRAGVAGHTGGVRMVLEEIETSAQPPGLNLDIVVGEENDFTGTRSDSFIPCSRWPTPFGANHSDPREIAEVVGGMRAIIHHHNFGRTFDLRHLIVNRPHDASQQLRAIL